jgi:hypothetical protein
VPDDDSRIIFWTSPGGARSVEITWIAEDAGRFGRDKRVARAEATHARIHEWGGSNEGDRVVTVVEADRYISDLKLHQAQQAVDGIETERKMATWLDSLCSRCPHCQEPRRYAGLQRLQEGGRANVWLMGEAWAMSNVDVHVYQCIYCGSLELFRDGGPIEHPIPGNRGPSG